MPSQQAILVSPTPPDGYTDKDKKVIKIYPDLHEALGKFVENKGDLLYDSD